MRLVVDASVAIQWYLREQFTVAALNALRDDISIHAPELLVAEFGNVLWKKVRAGDINRSEADTISDAFLRRRIHFHPLRTILAKALENAIDSSIPVYDWIYVVLADSLDCRFVTADRKFFLAVRKTALKKRVVWIEELL
jgi:predicted nucleic acid-binding protein